MASQGAEENKVGGSYQHQPVKTNVMVTGEEVKSNTMQMTTSCCLHFVCATLGVILAVVNNEVDHQNKVIFAAAAAAAAAVSPTLPVLLILPLVSFSTRTTAQPNLVLTARLCQAGSVASAKFVLPRQLQLVAPCRETQ